MLECELQVPQKYTLHAGGFEIKGASYSRINSLPLISRNPLDSVTGALTKAEPLTFSQCFQLQSSNGPTSRCIANFTPPHKQLLFTGSLSG